MAYFPNGTAGEVLDRQCQDCPLNPHGDDPCEVSTVHLLFNYDQVGVGHEKLRDALRFLVSDNGTCQVRRRARDAFGLE